MQKERVKEAGFGECETGFEALFASCAIMPPADLAAAVRACIARAEKRAMRITLAWLSALSITSLAGVVVSFFYLGREIAKSGFLNYISLLSDKAVIVTYWKEISFSLIESVPLVSLAALLLAFGIFVWSSTRAIGNAKTTLRAA